MKGALALAMFKTGSAVARAAPAGVATAVAPLLGRGVAMVAGERRRQVERNLKRVHGRDFAGASLRRAVGVTFGSYGRYWMESFRLPGTAPAAIAAGFEIDGWDQVEAALEKGRGAILAMPHLGGWEWGGFWIATVRGHQVTAVVEPLEPPELFEWFADLRGSLGMHVVPLGPGAGVAVLRALRANHVVCLLSDRDLDGLGVEVDFFGERTTLPGGPATLALRSRAPVLPAAVYFDGPRRYSLVRPPLLTARHGRLRDDVTRITQDIARELEALIRAAPEQWHLMQPNWPSDPGYRQTCRSEH